LSTKRCKRKEYILLRKSNSLLTFSDTSSSMFTFSHVEPTRDQRGLHSTKFLNKLRHMRLQRKEMKWSPPSAVNWSFACKPLSSFYFLHNNTPSHS
jgi:hypothetical protein